MPASERRKALRRLIQRGKPVPALGATDALSAKLIAAKGFECVYVGSYATAASRFGLPDTGLLALPEALEAALERFRASGEAPGGAEALEAFLDYRGFAERSRRYTG